ncbi:unnamed protein product [Caenorhabditis brenneri]
MGFPILRLPVVALKVLVDQFNDVELVIVSSLSKRADWFLKACGKKNVSFFNLSDPEIRRLRNFVILELFLLESRRQKELPVWNFELRCTVRFELEISISCRNFTVPIYFKNLGIINRFERIRRNLKIGDSFFPVVVIRRADGVEEIHTFWNAEADGMIVFMDYFKKNFNLSIEELKLAGNDSIRTVIDHLNSTQTLVKNVRVEYGPPLSQDDFGFILANISATESFSTRLDLRIFKYYGKIRAKNVNIENGHWFTLPNLLRCTENEEIYVRGSNFRRLEFRTFLGKWKRGEFPKLKKVNVATQSRYVDVTGGFKKRRDKCVDTWGNRVEAIEGPGNSYGVVYHAKGYFCMEVHND